MKKILLLAGVALFSFSMQAQELRMGAKAGVNFASLGGDETDDLDGKTGFHIGGLVEIPITEKFAVQPELLYSALGAKVEESEEIFGETFTYESKLKLDYIAIPIMAKYYIIDGLSVELGPQFGILVSAKSETEISGGGESESDEEDLKDFYNTLDLGAGIGASYRLPMGVFFSARYVLGFSNINKDSDDFKNQNNVIQISAGYSF